MNWFTRTQDGLKRVFGKPTVAEFYQSPYFGYRPTSDGKPMGPPPTGGGTRKKFDVTSDKEFFVPMQIIVTKNHIDNIPQRLGRTINIEIGRHGAIIDGPPGIVYNVTIKTNPQPLQLTHKISAADIMPNTDSGRLNQISAEEEAAYAKRMFEAGYYCEAAIAQFHANCFQDKAHGRTPFIPPWVEVVS